jgi:hypothetical protein
MYKMRGIFNLHILFNSCGECNIILNFNVLDKILNPMGT